MENMLPQAGSVLRGSGPGSVLLLLLAGCAQGQSIEGSPSRPDPVSGYGFVAPDLEPELFAFDLVGGDGAEFALAVSPRADELFFTRARFQQGGVSFELLRSVFTNGRWSTPALAPFASEYGEAEAFFDSTGDRLFFYSSRPEAGSTEAVSPMNLLYVEREGASWSAPRMLGRPGALVQFTWSAALLDDQTLYFTARPHENPILADIYEVSIEGNSFGEPRTLGSTINTPEFTENEPAIAPDGSYLVFYSAGRPDNLSSKGLGDLYISFRQEDGSWGESIHIDEPINSTAEENWPRISPDGRFLFFSSNRREGVDLPDLYWVRTSALRRYGRGR